MDRIITVAGAMIVALVVSWFLRRRKIDAPTQGGFELPVQLDRNDFVSPEAPWIVVVFTSATCSTCNDVATKAEVLSSHEVAVARGITPLIQKCMLVTKSKQFQHSSLRMQPELLRPVS